MTEGSATPVRTRPGKVGRAPPGPFRGEGFEDGAESGDGGLGPGPRRGQDDRSFSSPRIRLFRNLFRRRLPPGKDPGSDSVDFLTGDPVLDRRSLELLLDAMVEVGSGIDLDDLLERLVDKSIEVTRGERGFLLLAGEEGLKVRVARDARGRALEPGAHYSTTVAGKVLEERQALATVVQSSKEARDLGRSFYDLKLRAVMCAPMEIEGRLLGVIYVDSRAESREFDRRSLAFFAALARQMAVSLENARLLRDSLAKARLEKEVELAQRIQKQLLPEPTGLPGDLEAETWFQAAGTASGDTFDLVVREDGAVHVLLGDVTGHGIGPALIAHSSQAALRSYLEVLDDPVEVLERLNRRFLARLEAGTFLSLFLARLDPPSGGRRVLHHLNAGHAGVWRVGGNGTRRLDTNAPALGLAEDPGFALAEPLALEAGDLLFLCSDGLIEARSKARDFLGEARLVRVLEGCRGKGARRTVEAVVRLLESHVGGRPYDDDIMLLALALRD